MRQHIKLQDVLMAVIATWLLVVSSTSKAGMVLVTQKWSPAQVYVGQTQTYKLKMAGGIRWGVVSCTNGIDTWVPQNDDDSLEIQSPVRKNATAYTTTVICSNDKGRKISHTVSNKVLALPATENIQIAAWFANL
jgi:hypothetical protein